MFTHNLFLKPRPSSEAGNTYDDEKNENYRFIRLSTGMSYFGWVSTFEGGLKTEIKVQ